MEIVWGSILLGVLFFLVSKFEKRKQYHTKKKRNTLDGKRPFFEKTREGFSTFRPYARGRANTSMQAIEMLQKIDLMNGWEFERFTAHLLEGLGYKNVSVTSGSGDQGVDVLAVKEGVKYAIQCKKYAGKLNNNANCNNKLNTSG